MDEDGGMVLDRDGPECDDEEEWPVAIAATVSRKSRTVNGLDCTNAGKWAHAQRGRVVVDSQSITQV